MASSYDSLAFFPFLITIYVSLIYTSINDKLYCLDDMSEHFVVMSTKHYISS
jgi:hypothetical protein